MNSSPCYREGEERGGEKRRGEGREHQRRRETRITGIQSAVLVHVQYMHAIFATNYIVKSHTTLHVHMNVHMHLPH